MISFRRIASYVGAEPFRPFRITLTRGRTFDIRHPEMVTIGRSTLVVYTFFSTEPDEVEEQPVEVSLFLTESVEPLDATASPREA